MHKLLTHFLHQGCGNPKTKLTSNQANIIYTQQENQWILKLEKRVPFLKKKQGLGKPPNKNSIGW